MGRTFTRINLASTNDFPPHKNDKIKGWVEHNGGTFSKEITPNVTHLVASKKAWKNYIPMVKEARRLRSIRIVKLEWLEDSLLSKTRRPLDTVKYEFEQGKIRPKKTATGEKRKERERHIRSPSEEGELVTSGISKEEKINELKRKRTTDSSGISFMRKSIKVELSAKEFDAECVQFERDMGAKNYRPFVDSKGFIYLMTLVRKDKLRDRLEKHRVKVRYAPYFSSEHATAYQLSNQNPHPQRKRSDLDFRPPRDIPLPSIEDSDIRPSQIKTGAPEMIPRLPPCPVPLYYFPKPYPYSVYPVIASSLPRALSLSNPHLRVRISDPWAQTLQLFEYEPPASTFQANGGNPPRAKTYACYTIYSRPGHRHVETLAPPGSTFDFAWNMFRKIFRQKVGVDWEQRETGSKRTREDDDGDGRVGGEDGADDDGLWDFFGPLRLKQQKQEGAEGRTDGTVDRRPSATVIVNTPATSEGRVEVQANTPEGGW